LVSTFERSSVESVAVANIGVLAGDSRVAAVHGALVPVVIIGVTFLSSHHEEGGAIIVFV